MTDIARRRADQTADGVPLHVLAHVEAQEFDPERHGELARHLRLADARGAGEQVAADGLLRIAQARAAHLHGRGELRDRLVLSVDRALQIAFQAAQGLRVGLGDRLGRDAGHLGDDRLDVLHADGLLALGLGHQHLRGARLVEDVDGLVRQLAVGDELHRQLHRRFHRIVGVAQLVELFVIDLQALEDLDGVVERRLGHVDLLEPTHQGAVLFEVLAELLVGGGAHALQGAGGERRL